MVQELPQIDGTSPVLIAGPTASGKSALALEIAERFDGAVINADALQVYGNWRILTARPSVADEARIPHHLYGHVPGERAYSVGQWLRDVAPLLADGRLPVIVGGTGLYFTALTEGLADIPAVPAEIRAQADTLIARAEGRTEMLAALDASTLARIDQKNPVRVQRAWEVWRATGRGLAQWQDETPPPLLPLAETVPILLETDKDWLNARIAQRFQKMVAGGALEEVRANMAGWSPTLPSAKAIGAAELMAHLSGETTLEAACESAAIATRQYAKRQRQWFRARMGRWHRVSAG